MEMPNTYHFTAHYDDGEQYEQGHLDQSLQDESRNAFFDIHFQPMKPLESLWAFSLKAVDSAAIPDGAPRHIAVNLRTGMFETDGISLFLHHDLMDDGPLQNFRLLFYRNPAPTITQDNQGNEVGQGYSLGYVLGWQANNTKGENVTRFISLPGAPQVC